jgi:cytochrome c-type biogenesis protein
MSPRRALWISSAFAFGILVTIALIGIGTAAAGRMMGDLGGWVNYGVAAVFFVVGLSLLGVFSFSLPAAGKVAPNRKGLLPAFGLGAVFGLALGPCTFAFMAPVLAATLKVASEAPVYAALLLLAYGLGHCSVIAGAGTSASGVQRLLNWNARTKGGDALKRVCGVLVILGGLYLLWTVPQTVATSVSRASRSDGSSKVSYPLLMAAAAFAGPDAHSAYWPEGRCGHWRRKRLTDQSAVYQLRIVIGRPRPIVAEVNKLSSEQGYGASKWQQ